MKLNIGIIGIPGKWSTETLADSFAKRTGMRSVFDIHAIAMNTGDGSVRHGETDLSSFDALVIKKISQEYSPDILDRLDLLRYLEGRGVRIFSRPQSIASMINRLSCTVTLALGNIPMPPTVVTESVEQALDGLKKLGKAVLKPLFSTKARGMIIVENGPEAEARLKAFQADGNSMFYMQQFADLPGRDLGLVFVGGSYIGAYARVSEGSWNTTTRSGGSYEKAEPPDEYVELARQAQSLFDLDLCSVDLAETPDGPIIFEVSAFGGFRGLFEATGINAAEAYADFVIQRLKGE